MKKNINTNPTMLYFKLKNNLDTAIAQTWDQKIGEYIDTGEDFNVNHISKWGIKLRTGDLDQINKVELHESGMSWTIHRFLLRNFLTLTRQCGIDDIHVAGYVETIKWTTAKFVWSGVVCPKTKKIKPEEQMF